MDTTPSSSQPEQATQTPNPTSSPKKKLSKKTLSFIGLLSIMLIVVGISIYVGYTQGQNQAATNQVSDNTTDSEENTEEDNQTDTQSEGEGESEEFLQNEKLYIPITQSVIEKIDNSSDKYDVREDWNLFNTEDLETGFYYTGDTPQKVGIERHRIEENLPTLEEYEFELEGVRMWISERDIDLHKLEGQYQEKYYDTQIIAYQDIADYMISPSGDLIYFIPHLANGKVLSLRVENNGPEVLPLIELFLYNLINPNLYKLYPDIVYRVTNHSENLIYYNKGIHGNFFSSIYTGYYKSGFHNVAIEYKKMDFEPLFRLEERKEDYPHQYLTVKETNQGLFISVFDTEETAENQTKLYHLDGEKLILYEGIKTFSRIRKVSSDSQFIIWDTYDDCFGCNITRAPAKTLIMSLSENTYRNIGRVHDFEWLENGGEYRYKEFISIECSYDGFGCSEDPERLPYLYENY